MKVDIYVQDTYGDSANVYVHDETNGVIHFHSEEPSFIFTPGQARELADALIKAAEVAEGQ